MYEVNVTAKVRDRRAQRYLDQLAKKVKRPPAPVLRQWKQDTQEEVERQFQVGGDPRWKRNTPSTIEGKGHGKVLFGRGGGSKIKDTIVVRVRRSSSGKGSVIAYDKTPYGIFHQEGRPGTWMIPKSADHEPYSFKIGEQWVTIRRGRQIRHPGLPRRSFIRVGIKLSRKFADAVWNWVRVRV